MQDFKIDKHLEANYQLITDKAIPNKWDAIFLVWGKEGTGKTTFASQGCYYFSRKITLNNVVFTTAQFDSTLEELPEDSEILWDESVNAAMSMQSQNAIAIAIVKKLTQIRKKKFKIFVLFPYLHLINKYFVSRCIGSIYIYAKGFDKRGYFKFYSSQRTELLYNLMKNVYRYNYKMAFRYVRPNFTGRFNSFFPFNFNAYEKKKDAARIEDETDKFKDYFIQTLHYVRIKKGKINISGLASWLGKTKQYLYSLTGKSQAINKVDNIINIENNLNDGENDTKEEQI